MAGAGYKLFNSGDVLTAAQVNTYLQEQAVMRFADAAARTTALSGVLAEGMVSYLDDTNKVQVYNGSAWVDVSGDGDITAVTAGTGISGGGTTGAVTITNDMATTITASGDIIVGTGSGTYDNLPIGTTGQVLTADTTVSPYKVKWATPATTGFVGCSLYKTSNQSIANTTDVALTFDSEYFDTDSFHSTVSNTSRITIPSGKGGKYLIVATLAFAGNATGFRAVTIAKNGGGVIITQTVANVGASDEVRSTGTAILDLVAGDYVEFWTYQNSGGSLNVIGFSTKSAFSAVYLGA